MLSRSTVFVLVAVLFAVGNCVRIRHRDAYNRVLKCMKAAFNGAKELAPELEGDPNYKITLICHFGKVYRKCLAEPFQSTAGSSEILDFYRVYFLEQGILEKRSGLCPDPGYLDELSDLVHKSDKVNKGILERENLTCIWGDPYAPCAGEAYRKCMLKAEQAWEFQADDLSVDFIVMSCFNKEAKKCDEPMLKHMNQYMQALLTHFQEKHGFWMNKIEAMEDDED